MTTVLRAALGSVLVAFFGMKLLYPGELVSRDHGRVWSTIVVISGIAELLLGLALLAGWKQRAAAVATFCLTSGFATHLLIGGPRAVKQCGCLGGARVPYMVQVCVVATMLAASWHLVGVQSLAGGATTPASGDDPA